MQFVKNEDMFTQFENGFVQKKMPEKIVMLSALLGFRLSMSGELITSIESLAEGIGYKSNNRVGKINDEIKECLEWLEQNNHLFVPNNTIEKLRPKELFSIQMNHEQNMFTFDKGNGGFVQFEFKEFDTIRNYSTKNNKGLLTLMFLNIKKRMNLSGMGNGYTFPSQDRLAIECGLSSRGRKTDSLINDLVAMGLLYRFQAGSYLTKNRKRKNANTLYSLKPIDKKIALFELCSYYRVDKFEPVSRPNAKKEIINKPEGVDELW